MKDGYCENCPNPIDCYQTGRCWPPTEFSASDEVEQPHQASLTEIVVNGMIARLRKVADEMEECGEALQLLENYVPAAGSFQRGSEMKGAADMARQWASEICKLNAETNELNEQTA